jgi:hypothetical protein
MSNVLPIYTLENDMAIWLYQNVFSHGCMHWCLYMFIQQVINIKRQQFYKEPPKIAFNFILQKNNKH